MAYLIILGIVLVVVGWAVYMSKSKAGANRALKTRKPGYVGGIRRLGHGKERIESDEQRSESILRNRERYDPTVDRLDPRHPEYKRPEEPPPAEP